MSLLNNLIIGPDCQVNPVKGLVRHYEQRHPAEYGEVLTQVSSVEQYALNQKEKQDFDKYEGIYSSPGLSAKNPAQQQMEDKASPKNTQQADASMSRSPTETAYAQLRSPTYRNNNTHARPWHVDYMKFAGEQQKYQTRELPQLPSLSPLTSSHRDAADDKSVQSVDAKVDTHGPVDISSTWVQEYMAAEGKDELADDFASLANEQDWLREFELTNRADTQSIPMDFDAWVKQYRQNIASLSDSGDVAWENSVEKPWLNIATVGLGYPSMTTRPSYAFVENHSIDVVLSDELANRAIADGLEAVRQGQTASSIEKFEKAVRHSPNNADAWFQLAKRQAELERDEQAIAAYRESLNIQPDFLEAWLGLATSLVNENCRSDACDALVDWLKCHPLYGRVVDYGSIDRSDYINCVIRCFFQTVHVNTRMDVDVQTALGLLFHMKGDYDKAVDCFRAAVSQRATDPYGWNKLGATLANNRQSEDAVEAYFQALTLYPGYVRARYNLGISCINLGAFREASEHFLTALTLQEKEIHQGSYHDTMDEVTAGLTRIWQKEDRFAAKMSQSIWDTLKVAFDLWDRQDLVNLCDKKDIRVIKKMLSFV